VAEQFDSSTRETYSAPVSPSVSVIIPAFNAAGHIGRTLESVFLQSFTNYEVILINDGSPDTQHLENVIAPYLSRLIYMKQENRGPSAARNFGIRRACGEWLAFLDSDDLWFPNYLEGQYRFLSRNPQLDMVYCDATLEGDAARVGKTFMQLCPSDGPVTFESLLLERTQPITSGTVLRRRRALAVGLFDEDIHCSEDHDLWMRVAHAGGKIDYHRATLLRRTIRAGSQGSAPCKLLAGELQTLMKLSQLLDLTPATRGLLMQKMRSVEAAHALAEGKELLLRGEQDKAFERLARSHAMAPSLKLCATLIGLRIAPQWAAIVVRRWLGGDAGTGRAAGTGART